LVTKHWHECPECKILFPPDHPLRVGDCCSRHCARIRDARHGVPSEEDRKAKFLDDVAKMLDRLFKP
jgi:hypothetical protein